MTREEAREILTHNWTRVDNPNYSESELDEAFFMAIDALSAAEPKTGEWKPLIDYIGDEYFECSKCHDVFYVEFGTPEDNNYNFCPNCGARMYKGGEDE